MRWNASFPPVPFGRHRTKQELFLDSQLFYVLSEESGPPLAASSGRAMDRAWRRKAGEIAHVGAERAEPICSPSGPRALLGCGRRLRRGKRRSKRTLEIAEPKSPRRPDLGRRLRLGGFWPPDADDPRSEFFPWGSALARNSLKRLDSRTEVASPGVPFPSPAVPFPSPAVPLLSPGVPLASLGANGKIRMRSTLKRVILLSSMPSHSHSIVPGGFDVTSYTTRFTPLTSLMMRVAVRARKLMS